MFAVAACDGDPSSPDVVDTRVETVGADTTPDIALDTIDFDTRLPVPAPAGSTGSYAPSATGVAAASVSATSCATRAAFNLGN